MATGSRSPSPLLLGKPSPLDQMHLLLMKGRPSGSPQIYHDGYASARSRYGTSHPERVMAIEMVGMLLQ
jgi:hypothetical protein